MSGTILAVASGNELAVGYPVLRNGIRVRLARVKATGVVSHDQ